MLIYFEELTRIFYISINDCPTDDSLEVCSPLQRKIISKEGRGEIGVLFAIFKNATEACLEVKFLPDDDFATGLYGAISLLLLAQAE